MRKLSEIVAFAFSKPEPPAEILPPKPDDLAMAFAASLLASGVYGDNMGAAIAQAWWAVPHFYQGRQEYVKKIAPLFFTFGRVMSDIEEAQIQEFAA